MAIKVNGTTVIDDSRNLSNVGGLKTVNGTSLVGSGNISAGASTTNGAVGTYLWGRPANSSAYSFGSTASGVHAARSTQVGSVFGYSSGNYWDGATSDGQQSGTWRCMGGVGRNNYSWGGIGHLGLWVRIS